MSQGATDRIELGLFASRVAALCEEMGAALGRTAFSPNIRDRLDYSCAAFDARGELLGQATHIPVHLGSMAYAMGDLAAAREWAPGDLLAVNDPFQGGTHLPDITMIAPAFDPSGKLIGFAANRAHHADIGAEAPGSMPLSTHIDQEGLRIPPTLLMREGVWLRPVLDGLLDQLRDGAAAFGDFTAQAAACQLGISRLGALAAPLGAEAFDRRCQALQDYAERLARASFGELPDGSYDFSDCLDDDGAGHEDITIEVSIEIRDGELDVSFEGTAPQVEGNLNCPFPVTVAAVFYVLRCLLPPQIPACAGAMRPFRIRAPKGCLVNARYPAAVTAGNVETSMRLVDVVCGALAGAVRDRIPAASQGTMNNLAMGRSGVDGWDYYETLAGGMGAGPSGPGVNARHSHMTNTLNTPVEVLERHYPLRVERYAQRLGSGGDGEHAGGDGVIRAYRFLEPATLSIISERRRHGPWGLAGGHSGKPGAQRLDGQPLPGKLSREVEAGQLLEVETPGGGGWGAPPAKAGPSDHS